MKKLNVKKLPGWVLISPDDSGERVGWYISWHEIFDRRMDALRFAREHGWTVGAYRAVRASLQVS